MLDDHLPRYDVVEVHRITSAAPPAALMEAVRELTPRDVPLLMALMAVRGVPALLSGRGLDPRGSIIDIARRAGFVVLEDSPEEVVLGAVGRFWRAAGGLRRIAAPEFPDFAEPGFAKAAICFRVAGGSGRSVLTTETRVLCTDSLARRSFRRYWLVVRPGSAAIRIAWLRAIRRRAER